MSSPSNRTSFTYHPVAPITDARIIRRSNSDVISNEKSSLTRVGPELPAGIIIGSGVLANIWTWSGRNAGASPVSVTTTPRTVAPTEVETITFSMFSFPTVIGSEANSSAGVAMPIGRRLSM